MTNLTILSEIFPERACGRINLYEDEKAIYIEAPVPGVQPENIQITIDQGHVMIDAKRIDEQKDITVHLKCSSNFSYCVPLPEGIVDEKEAPEAVCKDGMLKMTFLKTKASKPLKIAVKSA